MLWNTIVWILARCDRGFKDLQNNAQQNQAESMLKGFSHTCAGFLSSLILPDCFWFSQDSVWIYSFTTQRFTILLTVPH